MVGHFLSVIGEKVGPRWRTGLWEIMTYHVNWLFMCEILCIFMLYVAGLIKFKNYLGKLVVVSSEKYPKDHNG